MAKVNVTIHGEEDVSTASQKVRQSLHELKDKAKETISPFKDLTDTIKTVAGLGGAAMVLKQIYGELSQMEAAFAKANPEAQKAAGSLQQWNDAMVRMKVDAGGVVAGVMNPIRDALLQIIDPAYQVKSAIAGLNTELEKLTGQYLSAETKKLQDLAKAQKDLADAMKESGQAATSRGEYARMLRGLQASGRPDTSGEGVVAYMGQYGVGAEQAIMALTIAAEEYDRQVADLQGFITDLDVTIQRTGLLIQEIPKKIAELSKPSGKAGAPDAEAAALKAWLEASAANYLAPAISSALRGQLRAEDLTKPVVEAFGHSADYLAPAISSALRGELRAELVAIKEGIALLHTDLRPEGEGGPSEDYRAPTKTSAERGEERAERESQEQPAEVGPSLLDYLKQAGSGLSDLWSGGTTGQMFAAGADPMAELAGSIAPLLASFGSLQAIMDPVSVILRAMFEALQPLIDSLLEPLVAILTIVGQTLAMMITPILKLLAPAIEWIGQAFVWLYNNAIVPIGNAFIQLFTALTALGTLIYYIVTFRWSKIHDIQWAADSADLLQPITTGQLTEDGLATTGAGGYGGSSTNVVKPPDIYVYLTVEGSVYGAGGPAEVGREMVHAIEEYLGTGARVTFLEAGA